MTSQGSPESRTASVWLLEGEALGAGGGNQGGGRFWKLGKAPPKATATGLHGGGAGSDAEGLAQHQVLTCPAGVGLLRPARCREGSWGPPSSALPPAWPPLSVHPNRSGSSIRDIAEPTCLPHKLAPKPPTPAGGGHGGQRGGRQENLPLFPSRGLPSSQPLPRPRGRAVQCFIHLRSAGTAWMQELIVLTLTCFSRTGASINHFLVALPISALLNALHLK